MKAKIPPRVIDRLESLKMYAELEVTKNLKNQGIKSLWDNKKDETGSIYIAQTDNDQLEVRVRFFANMFNEKPSASAVLYQYISP